MVKDRFFILTPDKKDKPNRYDPTDPVGGKTMEQLPASSSEVGKAFRPEKLETVMDSELCIDQISNATA